MHANNAWKKDTELYVQACRVLKHHWCVLLEEFHWYTTRRVLLLHLRKYKGSVISKTKPMVTPKKVKKLEHTV